MVDKSGQPETKTPRDAGHWATPVGRLKVGDVSDDAVNINVEGRQVVGPLQGFGQLWQKTYSVRLSGASITPQEVIKEWKENFPKFWPDMGRFYAPLTGIAPGEVGLISVSTPGGVKLSTGVMVMYADEESFAFVNPEGHMFAGWITFSSHESEGVTVAQVQVLIRANDPIYEIGMRMFGFKKEDQFWQDTLASLAGHFDAEGYPTMTATVVDPKLQWSEAKNVWHNALIRSAMYTAAAPVRWALSPVRGKK